MQIAVFTAAVFAGGSQSWAAQCSADAPVAINVGFQNVKMLAWPTSRKVGDNHFDKRILAFRKFAQTRDVVGFSEVFYRSAGNDANWKKFKFELEKDFPYRARSNKDNGLVLVSKYPMSFHPDRDELEFSHEAPFSFKHDGYDSIVSKGAIHARVHHPQAGMISVFVTHLQSGLGIGGADPAAPTTYTHRAFSFEKVRQAQMRELRKFVTQKSRGANGVILMGDFNIQRRTTLGHSEYKRIFPIFSDFTDQTVRPASEERGNRLDYILTSNSWYAEMPDGLKAEYISWEPVTNHYTTKTLTVRDEYLERTGFHEHRKDVSDHPAIFGILCTPTARARARSTQVIFYEHCNYRGRRVVVPNGKHPMRSLMALGLRDNDVSSIKVFAGNVVAIYQHDNFGGRRIDLRKSEPCLNTKEGKWFNDKLSSAIVWRE